MTAINQQGSALHDSLKSRFKQVKALADLMSCVNEDVPIAPESYGQLGELIHTQIEESMRTLDSWIEERS